MGQEENSQEGKERVLNANIKIPCLAGEVMSAFEAFLEDHWLLMIIGSVIVSIIILILIIAAILSLVAKRKKREDMYPLTEGGGGGDDKDDSGSLSRGEKQALSLIMRANKD